jgi:hypothetical protein
VIDTEPALHDGCWFVRTLTHNKHTTHCTAVTVLLLHRAAEYYATARALRKQEEASARAVKPGMQWSLQHMTAATSTDSSSSGVKGLTDDLGHPLKRGTHVKVEKKHSNYTASIVS